MALHRPLPLDTARSQSSRDEALGPAPFRDVIGYHLRVAQDASFRSFSRRVGNADLKPGRYTVLRLIAATPGLTPTELSRACRRDKSTLTPALRDLEARGLVQRHSSPDDQRSYKVSLTAAGDELLGRLSGHAEEHDRALDQIVGDDKALLLQILNRIVRRLGDAEAAAAEATGSAIEGNP